MAEMKVEVEEAEVTALTVVRQVTWLKIVQPRRRDLLALQEGLQERRTHLLLCNWGILAMEEEPEINRWRPSQDLIGVTLHSHQILHLTKKLKNPWRAGTDKLTILLVDGIRVVNQQNKP